MVIKQGNEIPQFQQHSNEICKQKQKKAKVSTTTTKKSTIKPRSPAAAPFDEPSKYGGSIVYERGCRSNEDRWAPQSLGNLCDQML